MDDLVNNKYLMVEEDNELNRLADNITSLVNDTKKQLARTINNNIVETYWNIGKYIVEFEQNGNAKARYGTSLLSSLSKLSDSV